MKRLAFALLALVALGAKDPDADRHVYCQVGQDCADKWGRAVAWVVQTSPFRVTLQSPTILQTDVGDFGNVSPGFTLTRLPLGDGREEIILKVRCNAMICLPSKASLHAQFVRFVDPQ